MSRCKCYACYKRYMRHEQYRNIDLRRKKSQFVISIGVVIKSYRGVILCTTPAWQRERRDAMATWKWAFKDARGQYNETKVAGNRIGSDLRWGQAGRRVGEADRRASGRKVGRLGKLLDRLACEAHKSGQWVVWIRVKPTLDNRIRGGILFGCFCPACKYNE